ncbi:hypothetical protein BK133_16555 [Paenibacillus sp. FSL H8-0548]|uniref:YvrJ family protein n=1 Tax=Paenibacillus sp. FSL H8-0548 TaxID=1920422 RepID=UPI00096BD597|nr:YvrJ family protein [Paenibacillus sp. FSL H8-0548]OMF30751.1 hypothetical protein BK133_16555 [Paenibacillus sp. FSL H8-0548]
MDETQPLAYFITAMSEVGFPIVLTGYLLFRFEKKLEALTDNILKLRKMIKNDMSEDSHGK